MRFISILPQKSSGNRDNDLPITDCFFGVKRYDPITLYDKKLP